MLTDSTVVVAEDLLIRLHTQVGASLKIGDNTFRIAAILVREPDRMSSGMGLGPRVMMTQSALEKSGLLQQGSRSGERFLFKLSPGNSNIAKVRARLEQVLPDAQVTDFRESNPALTDGLKRSTGLLSLICLVAMVLGAIGVAMAMRAHLQQRVEVLAIMKSIGARSSDILRIYLFQTVLLGLVGGLIGVCMGLGVEWVFPTLLGKFLPLQLDLRLPWHSALAGLATGILTTVLFCLPPLLQIRSVRPNLVLRRMVEEPSAERSWWVRLRQSKAQWIIAVSSCWVWRHRFRALRFGRRSGAWFAGALCALLIVILGVSALTLRVLRAFLSRTRMHLQSAVRHGLANLYRPGNQSAAVLAALGTGVMLILTVFLMQHGVIGEMKLTSGPNLPNIFLVDISSKELDGVKQLLAQQPAVDGEWRRSPPSPEELFLWMAPPPTALKLKNYPKRLLSRPCRSPGRRRCPHGSYDGAGSMVGQGRWAIARRDRAHCAAASSASRFAHGVHFERKNHFRQGHGDHSSQWPARVCAQRIHPHAAGSGWAAGGLVWRGACRPASRWERCSGRSSTRIPR